MKLKELKPLLVFGSYIVLSAKDWRILEKPNWNKGKCDECEVLSVWSEVQTSKHSKHNGYCRAVTMICVTEANP